MKTLSDVKLGEQVFVHSSCFHNEHGIIYIPANTECSSDEYKGVTLKRIDDSTFTYKGKIDAAPLRKTGRKTSEGDYEYEHVTSGRVTINLPTVKQWSVFGYHITLAY